MTNPTGTLAHAIFSTEVVLEILRINYSFNGDIGCTLEKSAPNNLYRIATRKGNFALKLSSTPESIEFEFEYVRFLRLNDVKVSNPIATNSGTSFCHFACGDWEAYGVLHEYVEGRELSHYEPQDSIAYGRELARLHLAGDKFEPNSVPPEFEPTDRLERSVDHIIEVLDSLDRSEPIQAYRRAAAKLAPKLDSISAQCISKRFLHGDTHGGNAKLYQSDIWFFDFELSCRGPIEWDFACFLWASKVGKREESYYRLIKGYRETNECLTFSQEAVDSLAVLKEFEVVGNQLTMSKVLGSWFITDRYLEMRLDALRSDTSRL